MPYIDPDEFFSMEKLPADPTDQLTLDDKLNTRIMTIPPRSYEFVAGTAEDRRSQDCRDIRTAPTIAV
jgi:hypothetical protein